MAELTAVDGELCELSDALGKGHKLPELTARGLVATCTSCGGIMGIRDRHCPGCGAAAGMVTASDGAGPIGETVDLPALDPAELEAALPEGESPVASRQSPVAAQAPTDRPPGEELDDELDDFAAAEEFAGEDDDESGHGFLPKLERELAGMGAGAFPAPAEHASPAPTGTPQTQAAQGRPPRALVPKAQRTLRAGRRRARAWLAERRPEER